MPISPLGGASGWSLVEAVQQPLVAGSPGLNFSPVLIEAGDQFYIQAQAIAVNGDADWGISYSHNSWPLTGTGVSFVAQRAIGSFGNWSVNAAGTVAYMAGLASASTLAVSGAVGGMASLSGAIVLPITDFFQVNFNCTDDILVDMYLFKLTGT